MNWPGLAVGWISVALANAAIAWPRGRSAVTWFWLSVPLGPIATLLLVLLPARPDDSIDNA